MLPKTGIVLPKAEDLGPYAQAIAYALKAELGPTHQAVKTVMGWTGAGERTVKNWIAGISGPSGDHLVKLIQHSGLVLQVLLILGERPEVAVAHKLLDVRNKLSESVAQIDLFLATRESETNEATP
jgi:hypothetical protein